MQNTDLQPIVTSNKFERLTKISCGNTDSSELCVYNNPSATINIVNIKAHALEIETNQTQNSKVSYWIELINETYHDHLKQLCVIAEDNVKHNVTNISSIIKIISNDNYVKTIVNYLNEKNTNYFFTKPKAESPLKFAIKDIPVDCGYNEIEDF